MRLFFIGAKLTTITVYKMLKYGSRAYATTNLVFTSALGSREETQITDKSGTKSAIGKKATPIDRGGFDNPNEGEKSLGADSLQQNGTNFIRIHIG